MPVTGSERRARLADARLYLVCDSRPGVVSAGLAHGVDVVQLRDKNAGDAELLTSARELRALCDEHGALLVINDRPDLAVAAGADGVHVGQDDVPVAAARAEVGPDRLVGLSTHTPAQVDAAHGVDYIGVGPVHPTPTKAGRPAVGLDLVRHAAARTTLPFFAIGGIARGNIDDVIAAGATRVAVVRAIAESDDPGPAAAELRAALEAPVGTA